MIKQVVLIVSLLVSSSVFSEPKDEWILIFKAQQEGWDEYWNPAHIKVVNETTREVEHWTKKVQIKNDPTTRMRLGDYSMSKEAVRCSDGYYKIIRVTLYRKGEASKDVGLDGNKLKNWYEPIPESGAAMHVKTLCSIMFPT